MKEIKNIIIPNKRLSEVKTRSFTNTQSWWDLTHYNVSGRGHAQHELKEVVSYEGGVQNRKKVYAPEFESRTKVEVVVPDSAAKEIIVDDVKSVR